MHFYDEQSESTCSLSLSLSLSLSHASVISYPVIIDSPNCSLIMLIKNK